MRSFLHLIVLLFAVVVLVHLAGCGNVSLSGDALTAAQASTTDAYQAYTRACADPGTPAWEKAYLAENFKQWRFYVRSAVKDLAWGPKLPDETAATSKP